MTKDVLVTVTGFQSAEGEKNPTPVELITPGTYYHKNGFHYLYYYESEDGSERQTRNFVRFSADQVDVRKQGVVDVNLLFIPGKRTESSYRTMFGSLSTAVTATRLILEEEDDEINLNVRYALSIGGADMEDCEIQIHIVPQHDSSGLF
jgi:uncharacterized beta-barrel protein YwiB (DUF1934 family)